jgi:hypothetical protein
MIWIGYAAILVAISALGLILAGLLGAACVDWYQISSFEGKSGYFTVGIALLGAIIGLGTAIGTLAYLRPSHGPSLLHALAWASGLVGVCAVTASYLAWAYADIPPTIDGQRLRLDVELMLPADSPAPETGPSKSEQPMNTLRIYSTERGTVRASREGTLDVANARLEQGRWIIPGNIELFTQRGTLSIHFQIGGQDLVGFLLPLPARPTRTAFEWTPWSPRPKPPAPPWPDSQPSYRVRVRPLPDAD